MGYYIKICYLKKLNNNQRIGLKGSSSAEYSTLAERTEMALKYCQSHKCHTYDTKDRKRGPKGNKRNQTRTIGTYSYGNGNFCTLQCQNDWWALHGPQAVDHFGRLFQPKILTAENGWRKVYNRARWEDDNAPQYIERNMLTKEERPYNGTDN